MLEEDLLKYSLTPTIQDLLLKVCPPKASVYLLIFILLLRGKVGVTTFFFGLLLREGEL
ncbi:MAG: hypothetical protein GY820_01145 [Gammaproteobacteria bacterium]|nr:hypothetical protein [Gammaproteobacteria bacterium]